MLRGAFILLLFFPFLTRDAKSTHIRQWSTRLLVIFGVELQVAGLEWLSQSPRLFVANHISWLDIHVINACEPMRFVAKSEVADWPVFGWMARQLGTVFVRRDSARDARKVVHQLAGVLESESICIFPEGTSTLGRSVLPFRSNLLESALQAKVPVSPIAIRYRLGLTGERAEEAAFVGDMGLLESMANILNIIGLRAELVFLPPLDATSYLDRKQLASAAQHEVARAL